MADKTEAGVTGQNQDEPSVNDATTSVIPGETGLEDALISPESGAEGAQVEDQLQTQDSNESGDSSVPEAANTQIFEQGAPQTEEASQENPEAAPDVSLGDETAQGNQEQDQIQEADEAEAEAEEAQEVQVDTSTEAGTFTQDISGQGSSDLSEYIAVREEANDYTQAANSLDALFREDGEQQFEVSTNVTFEDEALRDALAGLRNAIREYQEAYQNFMSETGDVAETEAALDALRSQLVNLFTEYSDLLGISEQDIQDFANGDNSLLADILQAIQDAVDNHAEDINEALANIATAEDAADQEQLDLADESADIAPAQAAVDTAQASVDTAQDAVTQAETDLATAQADHSTAQAAEVAAQADVDQAATDLATAQADLATAQAAEAAAQGDVTQETADLATAQADLVTAQQAVATAQDGVTQETSDLAMAQTDLANLQNSSSQSNSDAQSAVDQATSDLDSANQSLSGAQQDTADAQSAFDQAEVALQVEYADTADHVDYTSIEVDGYDLMEVLLGNEPEPPGVNIGGGHQGNFDDAYADFLQAQSDLTTAQVDEALVQADVTQAQSDLESAQTALDGIQTAIDGAQSAVTQAQQDLSDAQTALTNAQGDENQAQSDVTQSQSDLATAQSALTQAQADVAEAQTLVTEETQHLNDAQSDLATAQADVAGTQATVTQETQDLADCHDVLTQAQGDLATAQTNLAQETQEFSDAQTDLAAAQDNLSQAQADLVAETTESTTADDLAVQIDSLVALFNEAQGNYDQQLQELQDAQDALDAAQDQVDVYEDQVAQLNTNDSPIVNEILDQLATEDVNLNFDSGAFFGDMDVGDVLSFSLAPDAPDWVSIDSETGIISGTPTNDDLGTFDITVIATDLEGGQAQDTFQMTVNNTNDAPTVTPITDRTTAEDDNFTYDVADSFNDEDTGDSLTYSLVLGHPDWISIDEVTGVISGVATNEDVGTSAITVVATDESGASVQQTFEVTTTNTNDAPTVTAISDTNVSEGSTLTYDVSDSFDDADLSTGTGESITYSIAPGAPAWISIDADTGVISGTTANEDVGTAEITVIATDESGESVQETFEVEVVNVNDAPTVTPISDTSVNEDASLNYDVSGQFADVDVGDTLTYSLAPGAPAWVSIDVNTGVLTGTPDNGDVGINTVTVIATDGSGETVQDTFDVTVNNTNDAPTVTPISDTAVNEDAGLNYDVSGQFADMDVGDTLTYSLAPGAPAWVSIDVNTGILTGTPDNGDVGTSSITVIADDGNGGTVQDTFDVTVNNTNDAPTVTPISDTAVNEDAGLNYDVSGQFTDSDVGDTLTYSLAPGAPAWVSIDANTGILTGTPLNADVGVNTITVIADDGNGGTVQDTFDITVNNTNDAPTVTPISDTAVNEDAGLNYDVSGQFADMDVGDTLTYSLAPGAPAWVSIDVNTGILTGTPLNADVGVNTITVIADDGNGGTVQDTFDVTVNNTNDAPTVTPISDTAVNEDAGLNYDVSGQFADMDVGDTLTYSLAPGAPAWVSIDVNTGVLTGTPDNGDVGTSSITVIADDGNGGTVQDTFDVTVNNTNDAPTVTPISDTAVNEDSGLSYDVSGQFADMDVGDTLTYSLAPGAPAWVSIDVNTGVLTGTPDNGDVGTSSITVIADDGNGGTVQDTFDVTVNNTNDAPTVTPISDTAVNEDAGLNYDVSGQFADVDVGDTLTYSLAPGAPAWVSIDANTGILTGTPLNPDVGVNTITVIADDGNGGTVQDTFDVTVNNTNDAPTVTPISDTAATEGVPLSYDVSGQFADMDVGDTLTYSLAPGAPAWVSIDVNTGVLTGTPDNGDVGTSSITVIADDGNGGTVQDTFDVTVNNTNDAPTVTPISDTAVNEDAGLNYDVSGQFADADVGDVLTFSLAPGAPAWVSIDANTGILTGTPLNADVGVNTITVIADDGNGGTVQDTFDVTVNNTNDAPTVTPISDTAVNEDASLNYDVSGQFADMDVGDTLTYSLAPGAPAWVSIDVNTGILTGTPDNGDVGVNTITVIADDGNGGTVQDTFDVTVNNTNDAPTVTPISDTAVNEDAGLNYDVSGQFADMDVGDTLTYSLAPGAPAWVSIDVNTGILTGTPLNADVGVNTITVIADDGNGGTVQDTFDVTVNNTNDAPTVTPISDTAVNEDAGLNYDVSGQFTDMDVGDTLTYSLAPGAPAWVSIDVNTGILTGTPLNADVGVNTITVIADDGNGGTVQDTFDVTVNNTNDAPTVTPISDTSVNEDAGLNYDVSGQFADADVGDVLTFSLAPGAPAWVSIDANTGVLTGTPNNGDVGTSSITVIADDGNGGTVQDTFDVTVNNTNDAPTVTPISDTAVNEDASLNYDVSGQFADMDVGDTLTYSLAPGAPAWVSIDVNTGILTGTPDNGDVGVNTITVIADDGNGGTVQDTFDVTVNNTNDAPTVTPISDTAVNEDAGLNYDVSGQFADMDVGDTLTYSLAPGAPAWVSIDVNTGILTGTPLNGDVGVNTITVIADDGNGGTVQDTFDVTVNNTNDAPTVTPISDTAVNEDAGLNYDVSGQFTDMDVGDTLTYSLAPGAPAWVSIDVNTGILTGTPLNADVGVNTITVIADDGNGGTVQDTFDVTVNNTNDAPTVTPISDTAVNEDAGLNYDVSGQFADMDVGDTLTYSLAPGAPAWVSIDANTGILTGTPLNADVGVNTITVIADDGNGGTVQDTFDVTVNNTNDAPTVTPISDTAVNEDAGLNYDVSGQFADMDVGDTLTYSLAPGAPAWVSIDVNTGILTGTPLNADVGVNTITVIADDGNGGTVQDTFDVTVNNTNDAPTVTPISDTAVNEDAGLNYDVSGQFADMDVGDTLTYSLAPGAPAWVSIDVNTGILTGTPLNADVGVNTITVIADDGNGGTVQDTFDVTVNNTNDAPTVTPISDTAVNEDAGLNYDVSGQFTDMDVGDTLTYSLAPGAPAWVSIDANTGILTGTPLNADVGVNTITVIADDGNGGTVQDTFDVTVNNTNDAPTVTPISDTAVNEDAGLNYDVSGQFADMDVGDTLTYSLAPGAPAWVSIDANTGILTGTPLNADVGVNTITVIADDGNGGTVQDTFDVTVNNTNDAPTVTPISDTAVNEDAGLNYDVSGQFADMDVGDTLTYSLAPGAPAWVSIDVNTGVLTGTPDNGDVGTSSITVIADDGNGGTVQDTFDVTVNNTNDAPTVTPISDTAVNEDAGLNYDVSGQFADMDVGDTLTYSLAPGAPAWVSIDVNTGILTGTPDNGDVGVNTITVIADDGNGGTVQDTFDVTVNNTNDAPTVTPISDTAVNEDAGLNYDVSGQFADMDVGDTLTYSLAPGAPAWVSIDVNTGILTGTPLNADVGVNTITVIADDGNGGTVQDTFDVTVNNTNDAPTVTPISDTAVNEDAGLNYDVSGQFADMDVGDTLTYSLAPGAPAWVSIDVNTGILTGTPLNADVGVNTITVIADDGNGGTVQDTFDVTVNNTNDAPTVTPISDTAVNEDVGLNYDVSGQFADMDVGDTLTYSLAPGAPAWVSIDVNTGVLTGTPDNGDVGVNTITVIADDGNGGTVQDTFDVTVNNTNDAPTVTPISDTAVNEDAGLNYDVSGQFADMDVGDTLTYSLAPGAPAWVSIDVNTGILTGTPLNADVGVNTITVIADDGNGGTVQDTFDVTVNNTNDAPTVTPISDTAVNEDAGLNYDVSGQFADMDVGDTLTYSLAPGAPAWVSIDVNTGILTGTPLNADVGVNTITVIADDGNDGTVQDTFDITVNNTNDAPSVTPISDTAVNEDAGLNYDVSGQFADMDVGDTLTYSLAPGAPAWVSIDANTGILTGTPLNADVGVNTITVIADDGNGGTVQDTFDVTVNNTNDAPTVTPISDTAVNEDASLNYDVSGQFADMDVGDTLTYSLAPGAPAWVSIDVNTGILTGTPLNADVGVNTITVIADDGNGGTVQDTFDVTVNNTNDAPTVTPISDTSVNEDAGLNYDVSGQFADMDVGDTLTYSLAPGAPAWVSIDANTGILTGTPLNADVGVNTITVIADDGNGGTVQDTFDVTVNNTNDAPTVTPISDTSVAEGVNLNYDVSGKFADMDVGDTLTYSLSPGAPGWLSINATTGILTGTPADGDNGVYSITVIGDDGNGGTAQDTFDITVNDSTFGTAGGDILTGTGADEIIFADNTGDMNAGTGAADTVHGGDGSDQIFGDAGNADGYGDMTDSTGGADSLFGEGGADYIYGDAHNRLYNSTGGADYIDGGAGDDYLMGDAGDDLKSGSIGGADTILGGDGADKIYGDAGWQDISGNTSGTIDNSTGGADSLYGGAGADMIYGDAHKQIINSGVGGSDYIEGGADNDIIYGDSGYLLGSGSTGGSDIAYGGLGADTIYGDAGYDVDASSSGADTLYGDAGADKIYGDAGNDIQNAGIGGNDFIYGGADNDIISGDAGDDLEHAGTIGGNDTLYGDDGNDVIYGDAGDMIKLSAQGGDDYIEGGLGDDVIYGDAGNLIDATSSGGNDNLYGGDGIDTIYGDAGVTDNGNGGNDYLDGGTGADLLYGGSGDDTIVYDAADSVIDGGAGTDILKIFDANVDLSGFGAVDFEEINLDEVLAQSLQLNEQAVLDMSVTDTLTIDGNSDDALQLDGGWTQGASVGGYTAYTSGAATVQVDDDIVNGAGVTIVP